MEQVAEVVRELAVMVRRKDRLAREIDETDTHITRLRGTLHRDFPELIDAIFPSRTGRPAFTSATPDGRVSVMEYARHLGVPSRQVYHAINDGWLHAPAVDESKLIDVAQADAMLAAVPREPPRKIVVAARAIVAANRTPLAPAKGSVLVAARVTPDGQVETKVVQPDPDGRGASVSFDAPKPKRSVLVAPIVPEVEQVEIHGIDPGGPDRHVEIGPHPGEPRPGPSFELLHPVESSAMAEAFRRTGLADVPEEIKRVTPEADFTVQAAPRIERMDQPAADPPEPEAPWDAPMAPADERPGAAQDPAPAPAPAPKPNGEANGHDKSEAAPGTGPQPDEPPTDPDDVRLTVDQAIHTLRSFGDEVVPKRTSAGVRYRVNRAELDEDELLDKAARLIARRNRMAQANRAARARR